MRFTVRSRNGDGDVDVPVRLVLLAGYTGRDQDAVQAHVAELAAHGVAAPKRVPAVYAVPPTRLVTASRIAVHGERTAGEAEFLILRHGDRLLIGLGSDHTDRELEEYSVVKSKQTCDKPVSPYLWRLDDVEDHWDELRLTSDVRGDDGWVTYQRGTLAEMLTPQAILDTVAERLDDTRDAVVFSGTLPIVGGEFRYGAGFRTMLDDPVLDRRLHCEYAVDVLPDADA